MRIRPADRTYTYPWVGYIAAIAVEAAVTAFLLLIQPWLPLGRFPVLYFLATGIVAYAFGAGPAILAFILGALAFDYYFLPPIRSLWPIADSPLGWSGWAALLIGTSFSAIAMTIVRRSQQNTREALARAERELAERIQTEEDLARQRGLYQGIVDNIPIYLVIWDEQLQEFRFNEAFRRDMGWTEADTAEGGFMAKVYPDPEYRREVEKFMLSLEPGFRDLKTTAKDGREVDVSWANIDLAGNISVGIGVNITERRRAEEEVSRLARRFQLALDSTDQGIYALDEQGRCILFNRAASDMTGWPAEETLGKNLHGLIHHSRQDGTPYPQEECPVLGILGTGKGVRLDNEVFWSRDGTSFPVQYSAYPIIEYGRITGTVVAFTDITEQKQAEKALKESEERLRLALEAADLGTWDLDLVNDVAVRSLRHDQIWGFQEHQPEWGLEIAMQRVVPEDRPLIMEAYERGLKSGTIHHENRIVWPDGSIHWISATGRVRYDSEGRPVRIIGVVADITEQKQAEKALRESEEQYRKLSEELEQRVAQRTEQFEAANKELEAFSYSVSHDLRAPLRIIDGFSLALLEDYGEKLDQEAKSYLSFLRDAAQRMAQLIDDILRLSRIGRAEMRFEEVDLSATALSILTGLRNQDPERQVVVAVQPGLTTCADTDLIRVVLENLLGNSWKYTSKTPNACIEFGMTVQDDERVYFVRDNGAGFDMAYADRLFTPFQRLHTETEFPGTGIGLSIVRRIISRHGGRVWAEGEVNKGATFYFTLPTEGKC